MTRICNFPTSKTRRCKQPIAGDKPNCGRHHCEISADQLGQSPVVYQKDGELHVWDGEPNDVYCSIHSDPAYQALYRVAGETPPCCSNKIVTYRDNDGKLHREDGPALIEPDGTQEWYRHGKRHRDDGPARVWPDGARYWYQNGERHRDNGPAAIEADGTQQWYQHGLLHRDDGPAEVWPGGSQFWHQHGELHREDGPAWIWSDGSQQWYWHDREVTEKAHARLRKQSDGV